MNFAKLFQNIIVRSLFLFVAVFLFSSFESISNNYHFVVDSKGNGDFKTVQEAINAVPDFRKNETLIFIKPGIYKEKLVLPESKANVVLIGEERDKTILTYDDFALKKNKFGEEIGTTGSSSFFVFGDGFRAENITFENSSGPVGQAVAVRVSANQVVFINCRFSGFQDTLYPQAENTMQYYRDCIIEGTVDFIFGWATAVFENCTIICKNTGYITAPSTNETSEFGFVFLNCKISGAANKNSFYLGRPWRPFAKAAFLYCQMTDIIKPEGWHNWNKPDTERTSFFAEYMNSGEGSFTGQRVGWSHQLNENDAQKYNTVNILGQWVSKYLKN